MLLDGALGTELSARGIPTPAPLWSAQALETHPEVVAAIHRGYVEAGAEIHTANTFRTRRRDAGERWEQLTRRAVELARASVPAGHRIAGSIAPLADCYRPDLSPKNPRPEHREFCRLLAVSGVDLLLCETFPHVGEALVAVEEAAATGLPVWVSFTAGPDGSLLTNMQVRQGARGAVERGASAVLINCTAASKILPFVETLAEVGVPFGVYANAGDPSEGIGWGEVPDGPARYAALAVRWVEAGATIVGGCCGTGAAHIVALRAKLLANP
ncbi:MAG: homocysteine S-methyltransferase family protein [Myxococcales bacterium]|nr:homocysteine S-methyltransferase family protein [Polyangiaceae bacterium]MDW8248803.1 homocysteine S-methyltransferase family protein [Myxococcales bacterium]